MKVQNFSAVFVLLITLMMGCAPTANGKKSLSHTKVQLAQEIAPSLVRVEYTMQYDKGKAPGAEKYITQERPLERPGFLLSDSMVITPEVICHQRFIKSVVVRFQGQAIKAKPAGMAKDRFARFFKLASPITGAKPLVFDAKAKEPYRVITYSRNEALWRIIVRSFGATIVRTEDDHEFRKIQPWCLIVDKKGVPVGMPMDDRLPLGDSWKGSPLDWPRYTTSQLDKFMKGVKNNAAACILRTDLSFRSPKKRPGQRSYRGQDKTERNVIGVVIDKEKVLVLANLPPKITARLERIVVHPPAGGPVEAKFQFSLKDYGAFVAKLKKPLPVTQGFGDDQITDYYGIVMPAARINLHGQRREEHYLPVRISSFNIGWRRKIFPQVDAPNADLYMFDASGGLVAFPIVRRPQVLMETDWESGKKILTPASDISLALEDPAKNADPGNVPLTEADENRLAWLGVVMQTLNKELARVNNISDQTQDGRTGGLISYIYPQSPAAKAGIKVGNILLRLHAAGKPKPVEIRFSEYSPFREGFPWDKLDQIPERYYDRLPPPWPPAENALTRALTDLGFGTKFQVELYDSLSSKIIRKEFTVVSGPTCYNSSPRYKDKALGLTVANMSYEVRRYFQKKPGDPGVIVAVIKPGSKASISGLKPYEIITHVNDNPVSNVDSFRKLVAAGGELRLAVKRLIRGRVVKIKSTKSQKASSTKPTTTTAPGENKNE